MPSILDIPLKTIAGADTSLGDFRGKVLLIVSVASECGLTPQYQALGALYTRYQQDGLVVLGFPANDFGSQEPGSDGEIQRFCSTTYGVTFPMFSRFYVVGSDVHPLYASLVRNQPRARTEPGSEFKEKLAGHGIVPESESDVLWNFEKFIVDRDGDVIARFSPDVSPDSPMLTSAIEAALERTATES